MLFVYIWYLVGWTHHFPKVREVANAESNSQSRATASSTAAPLAALTEEFFDAMHLAEQLLENSTASCAESTTTQGAIWGKKELRMRLLFICICHKWIHIHLSIYICIMMVMYCRTCIKNDFAWFLVWYNEYLMIIKAKLSIRLSWCHGRIYINPKGGDFVKQLGFDLARMQTSGGIEYNSYNRWAVAEGFSCLYSDYSRWGDSSRLCWPNNWGICRLRHRRSPKL